MKTIEELSDEDKRHLQFFRVLRELLSRHNAVIYNSSDYLIFSFKGLSSGAYYQTANPLFSNESSHTFDSIEFVTTKKVINEND